MKLNRIFLLAVLGAGLPLAVNAGVRVDTVYVHIDMDVLDAAEVPGHDLTVADGVSRRRPH